MMVRCRDALTLLHTRINTEERGATMVEYALLIAVIAVVVAAAAQALGLQVVAKFNQVGTCVANGTNC
jgi:pilus assembly protein Flp/PilA